MADFMKKGYRLRPNELLKQDPGLSNEIVLWVEIYGNRLRLSEGLRRRVRESTRVGRSTRHVRSVLAHRYVVQPRHTRDPGFYCLLKSNVIGV